MATNDEMRLKMTVSKMNIHRSTKLETIAANCIVRNLDSFLDPQYSETRNVKLLPSALRNIVLQHWLMKHSAQLHKPENFSSDHHIKNFEKRTEVIQSLVSCHTLDVDFTPFTKQKKYNYLARGHLLKYLNLIGANATNLKVLTVSEYWPMGEELNSTMAETIGRFRNLKSLNVENILVNYTNLKAMCKNLESLTHLFTMIHFNPNFDESNQREIEDLQIFSNLIVFYIGCYYKNFTINCIQRLPKLRCFGTFLKTPIIEELLDRCPNQKFNLTHMTLTETPKKEIHLSFPDVTNLVILHRNIAGFLNLPKFSKIENLLISDFESVDRLIPILDEYGQRLLSLRLNRCIGQFKLSSVLDRCPKLESLHLKGVSILPECSRPEIHSFSTGLKTLKWKYPRFRNGPAPSLMDILSVPTIECVTLKMVLKIFHLEDIERLTAMIASRQILGNLKRLKIFVINMDERDDDNPRVFRVLSDFIKSASAFLPHLTEIKTDILSNIQLGTSSEASLQVATLKTFIDVYEN